MKVDREDVDALHAEDGRYYQGNANTKYQPPYANVIIARETENW